MNAEQASARQALYARVLALIAEIDRDACAADRDLARDAVLTDLAAYQAAWLPAYARFCSQRRCAWAAPALPTDAFRFARISSRSAESDVRRFRSSGTTQDERSTHPFTDLSLYDAAAKATARRMLFPDRERMQLLIFAPKEQELPDSSLSYMLARFVEWFGSADSAYVWPVDSARLETLQQTLARAREHDLPVALLGTSFAFVHAIDALSGTKLPLPARSRIMQTGGFKGRSRTLSPAEMRDALASRFALDPAWIVAEYGMTELSSQLYENTLREAALDRPDVPAALRTSAKPRALWAPPWVRVSVVDPERLSPLPDGREGLIRIDDAANLDSVAAIQTADVGVQEDGALSLRGRAEGAIARGCSITADELLGGRER